MKILIISGFLGSGKTSFIKAMTRATGRQFVVVENEFGELDLDGQILKQDQLDNLSPEEAEMKIWELTEGCICCSLNLNFAHSVLTIANSLDPDYLLVEPSGVALPSNIIRQLKKIVYDRISLLAPITIIDAQNYTKSRNDFYDYFKDQVENAGNIILSKSESLSPDDFLRVKKDLGIMRKDVLFPTSHYKNWSRDEWLSILNRDMLIGKENTDGGLDLSFIKKTVSKDQELENIALSDIRIQNPAQLICILNALNSGFFGRIVRAKGYFSTGKNHLRFDMVEGTYSITGFNKMPDNRIVLIGRDLNKKGIEALFRGF